MAFLPTSAAEMKARGWSDVDIVLITGDAYVDHPSFGIAMIGRVLEAQGFRVGIIAMPDARDPQSIAVFGRPRLFFGVASGNVDSMIARYTAFKRPRSDDPYAPGDESGHKPDRALIVYCNLIKAVYKDVPMVLGGVEASMRRLPHYDFWDNRVRRSILEDTRAAILVYGMGEKAIVEVAARLNEKRDLAGIPGTVVMAHTPPAAAVLLPPEEEVMQSPKVFLRFAELFFRNLSEPLVQPAGKRFIVHNAPMSMTTAELDALYELPFERAPHPSYAKPIPAFVMIRDSVNAHRGCVSGCSFCSLSLHQGRRILSRSRESVRREVELLSRQPGFKGHITDIGGPSANMYGIGCRASWKCQRESCLFPDLCPNLQLATSRWLDLLDDAAAVPGVKSATVGSGIRYDLFMKDPDRAALLERLLASHISGELKIAPEHTSPRVLAAMRKAPLFALDNFIRVFREIMARLGKKQHVLPYLMSCHPGCDRGDMEKTKRVVQSLFNFVPEQVQAFIPLPMTLSSVIYWTGKDPLSGEEFPVTRDPEERRKQHDVFFSRERKPSGNKPKKHQRR